MAGPDDATLLLARLGEGDSAAADGLLSLVYEELRALAGSLFRGQRADHTLQPTALVHEAFIRLIDQTSVRFNDRPHFFAVAATAMRQILTDHARRTGAQKRGGEWRKVDLSEATPQFAAEGVDAVALHEALVMLAEADARQARIVELRFFGGLTMEEIAGVLGVSKATVELDWRAARAWLAMQLRDH